MPRKTITFDTVRELGLALPDVEADTYFGTPALKVRGKMFACITSHKSAEPNTLAVVIGFDRREELIAEQPDIYYLKEHYVGYPCVLVRLSRVHPDALRDLVIGAHRYMRGNRVAVRKIRPQGSHQEVRLVVRGVAYSRHQMSE